MMNLESIYRSLLEALKETQIPFAFIGALAATAWGRPRSTNDMDLVVLCDDQSFARLRAALEQRDFSMGKGVGALDSSDVLPDIAVFWAGPPPQTRLDVFIAKLAFEREVIATARSAIVLGEEVPTASPEAMLIYKLLANRPKDDLDVEGIIRVRKMAGHRLDWAFLERWADDWGIRDRLEKLRSSWSEA
jgi:hypothetical protein